MKTHRTRLLSAVQRLPAPLLDLGILAHGRKHGANANMRSKTRFWRPARLSLGFAAAKVDSMLFLAAIAQIVAPRESPPNDLLAQSRLGHAGLTVITLVYVLIILWQR